MVCDSSLSSYEQRCYINPKHYYYWNTVKSHGNTINWIFKINSFKTWATLFRCEYDLVDCAVDIGAYCPSHYNHILITVEFNSIVYLVLNLCQVLFYMLHVY